MQRLQLQHQDESLSPKALLPLGKLIPGLLPLSLWYRIAASHPNLHPLRAMPSKKKWRSPHHLFHSDWCV